MIRGSIRFPEKQQSWIELLRGIYEFESIRVAGPGSYHKDIKNALWTIDELLHVNPSVREKQDELTKLLRWLEEQRQIMVIHSDGGPLMYLTRVAEIVRLLGHTYEYWHRGRPGIDATRWLIDEKKFPRRSVGADEARQRLRKMVEEEIGQGSQVHNLLKAIDYVVEAAAKSLVGSDWKKARFSEFQIEAAEEMIRSQFKRNHDKRTQILTAGTSSGKTIGFTIGMMISAVEGLLGGSGSKRCHLFLYPRTALAKDQFAQLSEIAGHIPLANLMPHFEHADYYKKKGLSVRRGVDQTYGDTTFPVLIVTTLETLKRRLQRPPFVRTMARRLARVVLDEIHLVEDLTGTQIAHLLERLKAIAPEKGILWTGSSATVACPERHAATVFGVPERDIRAIEPKEEDMEVVGLVHHVFLRPGKRISTLGCLVNASSILVHNRRDNVGDRPKRVTDICKTIGFADNLDLLGRWNCDLRENERTENYFSPYYYGGRIHPTSSDVAVWEERQREIPYALRFHDPFTSRLRTPSGGGEHPYEPLSLHIDPDPCKRCRNGERLSFGTASEQDMMALGRFVYREPGKEDDKVEEFRISRPQIFENGPQNIGTLDLCPFLRAGACFWFPREGFETEPIPRTRFNEFRSVVRSRIYSSKVGGSSAEDDDLSSITFQAPVTEVYGPFSRMEVEGSSLVPVDMVVSSPSLEVGIDLENVTESFMFKAIRNVSSYRQKAGRAGRELGADTINVTLLSSRATDFHYYRQPRKLISARILDPIPLKRENPVVMKTSAYLAIWDLLALRADLPESIPTAFVDGCSEFTRRLERCLRYVREKRQVILGHLDGLTQGRLHPDEIKAAISRVEMDLEIFLTPTAGIIHGDELTCLADFVANRLRRRGGIREGTERGVDVSWDKISRANSMYDSWRPTLDPIALGLSEDFEALDRMRQCGWESHQLKEAISSLERAKNSELEVTLLSLRKIGDALSEIMDHGNPRVLFFRQQFTEAFGGENEYKAYYLSYIMEELPLFTGVVERLRFPRPKNLFTNPYEDTVLLTWKRGSRERPRSSEIAQISEVMHSYVPGTWTHRLGAPIKVDVGLLQGDEYDFVAPYNNIKNTGAAFSELKMNVEGPPIFGPETIDLYQPKKLTIERVQKYVKANTKRGTIVDNDEDGREPPRDERALVKVPTCYLERWTHVSSAEGGRLLVHDLGFGDDGGMRLMPDDGRPSKSLHSNIVHPLQSRLISGAFWHPKMEVIEYVFSVGRSYTSSKMEVAGSTLTFRNIERDRDIGLGRRLETEGVYLELDADTVNETISNIKGALNENPLWAPSALLAFKALLNRVTLPNGAHASSFSVRDVASLVLYSMIDELENTTFSNLIERFRSLVNDREQLMGIARRHVGARYHEIVDSLTNEGSEPPDVKTNEDIERDAERICKHAIEMYEGLCGLDTDGYLEEWVSYTLLNTFGVTAYHALQRLCGTGGDSIGYIPKIESMPKRRYGIFLYDRAEKGNGCSETLKRYLHILYLQRAGGGEAGEKLPTEDFLTILEQELLQCPQFHTDIGALELHAQQPMGQTSGVPELGYVHEHSKEVWGVSRDVWRRLHILGREDAWRLPLLAAMPHLVAQHYGLERDDVSRATEICWNGCPECVLTDQMLMGPLRGRDYVDKSILDVWFKIGRLKTGEYKNPTATEIAQGTANLDIGAHSRLCMAGEKKLWRSVSLPFTIGLELDRNSPNDRARLVIRDDDLVGMRLASEPLKGTARAVPIGFGRLVWYDLLMTAYLDSIGCIGDKDKQILMVFYEITDVPFEDIGMSERMWEALDYQRRKSGSPRRLERLSDLLGWLASRGFRIVVCVDTERARDEWVARLLHRLKGLNPPGELIRILTKEIPNGAMHIKGLITPVGAIDGTANLTSNAVKRNDESVNHANVGTRDYRDVVTRLNDALYGSREWKEE